MENLDQIGTLPSYFEDLRYRIEFECWTLKKNPLTKVALNSFKRKDYPLDIAVYFSRGYVFCSVCGDSCEMLLTARDYSVKFMMVVLLIQADTFYYINVPFQ